MPNLCECAMHVGVLNFLKHKYLFQAFELLHGWTGLLVEANPAIFPLGLLSGRKAWQVIQIFKFIIRDTSTQILKAPVC